MLQRIALWLWTIAGLLFLGWMGYSAWFVASTAAGDPDLTPLRNAYLTEIAVYAGIGGCIWLGGLVAAVAFNGRVRER